MENFYYGNIHIHTFIETTTITHPMKITKCLLKTSLPKYEAYSIKRLCCRNVRSNALNTSTCCLPYINIYKHSFVSLLVYVLQCLINRLGLLPRTMFCHGFISQELHLFRASTFILILFYFGTTISARRTDIYKTSSNNSLHLPIA